MRKSSRGNPYHDERGRFCSGERASTYSEKSESGYERQTEERMAAEAQKGYDLTDQASVKQYLEEQFRDDPNKSVSVLTKEGWVTIEPSGYGDKPDYYMVYGPVPWMGGDSLDKVSGQIAGISNTIKEDKAEKAQLADFYKKNIAGASEEDVQFSREVSHDIMEDWYDTGASTSLGDFFEANKTKYAEKQGKSVEEIEAAWNLSEAMGTYSDWHKDLYGYRPR